MQSKELKSCKFNIGSVEINSIVTLAPMAGVTDTILRQIIRLFSKNCLLMTEMLSSEALHMNRENEIINFIEQEYPLGFQISGHKPDLMAQAAKKLEGIATLIDINMGCPAPKIIRNFDGSKLMTDLKLASKIISSVKNAVNVPVTVKCRLGWDNDSRNYLEFAKMVEESGADAIIVHGRTRSQMYSGIADWHAIGKIKASLNIPVIGNGDINSVEKANDCLAISNCDGIAVGRGILGDPGLISRIENYLDTGLISPKPDISKILDIALLHCQKEMEYRGEIHGIRFMRKFFGWYIKGIDGASKYRYKLVRLENFSEIQDLVDEIKENAR